MVIFWIKINMVIHYNLHVVYGEQQQILLTHKITCLMFSERINIVTNNTILFLQLQIKLLSIMLLIVSIISTVRTTVCAPV
jgi:hypothetical protein